MQLSKKVEPITLDQILEKVTEFDIFKAEFPHLVIRRPVKNWARGEKDPSLVVYVTDSGHLKYKDFGDSEWSGGPVDFVMKAYGLKYGQALEKIAQYFGIKSTGIEEYQPKVLNYQKPILEAKRYTLIQVHAKEWDEASLNYWKAYGITINDLRDNDVWNVKEWFLNRKRQYIGDGELCFGYKYGDCWKIYYPNRPKTEGKWWSNVPLVTAGGLKNLSKDHNTLVTKSLKDYIVCKKIYPYTCYIQNESIGAISEQTGIYITENSKEVFYAGDGDLAGKTASYKITEKWHWKHINPPDRLLPDVKDFSDWRKAEGRLPILKHFKNKNLFK